MTPNSDFSTISGSINFTGLGSGTDFNEVIEQLVEIESIQKMRLEYWKTTWEAKIDSMRGLNARMEAVEEAAAAMDTASEFLVRSATASDTSVITGTADSAAVPGAYTITVGADVRHIVQGAGWADTDTTAISMASTEDLILEINGSQYSISINANSTIDDVVSAINTYFGGLAGDEQNLVAASTNDDGTASNPHHLVLTCKTGGSDYRINVVQNPLLVSLDTKNVSLAYDDNWTGGVDITVGGHYSGNKEDTPGAQGYDSWVIKNETGSAQTLGSGAFDLTLYKNGVNAGTITVPADYTAGDVIEVDEGFFITLGDGTINNNDEFTVLGYANNIDEAQLGTFNGTSNTISTGGNYLGSVNKTYSFTVVSGGSIDAGGTEDTVTLRWTDSSGNTGTVSVNKSGTYYEVADGVKIQFDNAGTLVESDEFTVNVFAADRQQAQDKGLAQVTKVVHEGFTDQDQSAVTTSNATFSYTYGGETISVAVSAGTTLTQLVSTINLDSDNPGVTASIINDGMGLPTSYKLVLTGQDTGAAYQITQVTHDFTGSSFNANGELGGGFYRSQWATNSMVKVDGFPASDVEYMQRTTNQVDEVVAGVSLNLHDSGEAVITVSTDTASVVANIEALINAVNYTQAYIRSETYHDPAGEETGLLIGNYAYYLIKSDIDSMLYDGVSGLEDGVDTYTHLSQIGIHTDPDNEGVWVIDSDELLAALSSDPDAVANLFIENTAKGSDGVAQRLYDKMQDFTDADDGILNVLISNYSDIISNLDSKIEQEEKRLVLYQERQEERFARLEKALTELNAQSVTLESAIAQLPGASKD